jgi:hypothetical protein
VLQADCSQVAVARSYSHTNAIEVEADKKKTIPYPGPIRSR